MNTRGARPADELAARLTARRRVRVTIDEIDRDFSAVRPDLAASPDRSAQLRKLLDELADEGVLTPSSSGQVRLGVHLPAFVTVAAARRPPAPANPAVRFPWVPAMAWAAKGRRRSPTDQRRLEAISRWIAANPARTIVPVRERSLEILGEDKALDTLADGLLREHPEAWDALFIERVYPPMAVGEVEGATGRDVLVVENGTTFHSALRAARHLVTAGVAIRYRWIGFGVGRQLRAIVPSLLDLRPTALDYFGDLDARGLTIAAEGARSCRDGGLPALRPSLPLYSALLDQGRPQPVRAIAHWPDDGLAWLGDGLAARVQAHLGTTSWLAQEWVGYEAMTGSTDWCR